MTTRPPGLHLLALACAAVAWLMPLDAFGYWTVAGSGVASASVSALATPTGVSASSTPGSTTVSVSWTAAAAPDTGSVDGYYVLRYRGSIPSAACGSSPGSLVSSARCLDLAVPNGTYTYRVVAVWRSWTSVSAPGNLVTVLDDDTPPTLSSIARAGSSPVSTGPLGWTVTFSEPVSGVAISSFALATSGLAGTAPSISTVTPSGGSPSATWTVSVSTTGVSGTNAGSIRLDLTSTSGIVDAAANPLSASLPVVGQAYLYDTTAPTLSSIARAGSSPVNTGPLTWTVTFAEPVSGVATSSFGLVTSSIAGAAPSISSITASGGAPSATWTVSVTTTGTTGANSGSIRLDLTTGAGIVDQAGNALSASLPVVGQAYLYDTTAPTVSSIVRAGTSPSNTGPLAFTVTFSEAVSDVATSSFGLVTSGIAGTAPAIGSVTASGSSPSATWTVSVSTTGTTGTNSGSIGLNLTSPGSIRDTATNGLSTSLPVVGQAFLYDTTAPTASDIQAVNGTGTAGRIGSGDVITYTFSEAMSPGTILAGWSGSSTAVSVTVTNSGSNDTITVVGTSLGTIATGGNYVGASSTVAATMVMSGSTVTVTLGASPTSPNTVASSTMTWTPSSSAKDLAGNAMSTTARTESGAPKRNF